MAEKDDNKEKTHEEVLAELARENFKAFQEMLSETELPEETDEESIETILEEEAETLEEVTLQEARTIKKQEEEDNLVSYEQNSADNKYAQNYEKDYEAVAPERKDEGSPTTINR